MEVREVQMPGHDDTNIVLIELVGKSYPFTAPGYAGMTSFVTVNPDPEAEVGFYRDLLGLPIAHELELGGPEIEKMVGLPPGTVLDLRVVGPREYLFGRSELVHYRGVEGTNRYPLARPPALGALHPAFLVRSLEAFRRRAGELQVELVDHGRVETIFGSGAAVTVYTPAGLRIDVLEKASR
jgi:catechol 2,3-dioxygenase-like lactoylglutathione lyase family enzyme